MSKIIEKLFGSEMVKTPFQVLIHLDRYTIKELDLTKLKVGDVIVATVDNTNPKHPVKDFGEVKEINGEYVVFQGEVNPVEFNVHKRYIHLPLDAAWEETVDRMVLGQEKIEKQNKRKDSNEFLKRTRKWLKSEKIVPGGRIQSSLGAEEKYGLSLNLTAYNCFVIPSPKDSRQGIIETLLQQMEIMSRGGGVGINISTLRPEYATVYKVNGNSSGSTSWGGLYSYATGLIQQGGNRRGALMLQTHVTHPDIFRFITVKQEQGVIENANLSVQITLEFYRAMLNDEDWKLIFPDTRHPEYDEKWASEYVDIHDWLNAGLPVIVHQVVKAKELWDLMISSAHNSAEPGIVVYDFMNEGEMSSTQNLVQQEDGTYVLAEEERNKKTNVKPWNNTYYYQKNVCTNPCGEQPLTGFGICNLSHVNLAAFFNPKTKDVDWANLKQVVKDAVRFADNVIDYTPYFLEENRKVQLAQRRIGLGTLGLHDLLLDLGLRYGKEDAVKFTDKLYAFIKNTAYEASAEIAGELGAFETYDEKILLARVPSSLDENVKELIRKNGLRNSHLLTQAPTGTTGTKTGSKGYSVSTGIEPYFALSWKRESRLGTTYDFLGKAKEYLEKNSVEELPSYFVSAMGVEEDGTPQITPMDHINMQAIIQKHNDSAISKTTNVPANFSVESTDELYVKAIELGLVGMTIYRDGSRDTQVLTSVTDDETNEENVSHETTESDNVPHETPAFYRRPEILVGQTIKKQTPFGKAYFTINRNPESEKIEEVFINLGKTGADIAAIADGLAIAITGMLSPRISGLTEEEKIKWIIKKFKGITGQNFVGFGPNRVDSLPDAVAKVFEMMNQTSVQMISEEKVEEKEHVHKPQASGTKDLCPSCGGATFVKQDGCTTCMPDLGGCGFSKCS